MLAFLDREGVPNPLLAFGDSFIKLERYAQLSMALSIDVNTLIIGDWRVV